MADDRRASAQGIPQNVRDMAENSLEQARRAVEQYLDAAHRTLETTERSADALKAGARDMRSKAIDFAEANVRGAFEFAERLVRAQTLQEIMSLQQDFLRRQTEQMGRQMRALGTPVPTQPATPENPGGPGSTPSQERERPGKTTKRRSRHQTTGD
jgi:phasin